MDPAAPATQQCTRLLGELWAQYLATHTQEEIDALVARAEQHRQMSRRIRLQVRPIVRGADEGSLTPVSERQET